MKKKKLLITLIVISVLLFLSAYYFWMRGNIYYSPNSLKISKPLQFLLPITFLLVINSI